MITYGSVCSGIEAASVAWEPLGMQPVWFSEIEPFPCSVLRHHWPAVPNLGDMTALPGLIRAGLVPAPAVLVGGTPCQAFSVAGARRGLEDERGQLTITYAEVLNEIDKQRPGDEAVCVWENVPGVLSSADNAFGCFLGLLSGSDAALHPEPKPEPGRNSKWWRWDKKNGEHRCKWPNAGCVLGPQRAIAWRVLDAQYFGVAQRRRRVFLVASARDGFDPTAVLFEREGVRRDTPPSREAGPPVAALTSNGVGTCGADDNQGQAGHLIPVKGCWWDGGQVSQTLDAVLHKGQTMPEKNRFPAVLQPCAVTGDTANNGKGRSEDGTGRGVPTIAVHGTQDPDVLEEAAHPLGRNQGQENAVFSPSGFRVTNKWGVVRIVEDPGTALWAVARLGWAVSEIEKIEPIPALAVRRLTPKECERLQGFPDGHTDTPHRGKSAADGPRYKAIGNSKAVPVVQWVGRRLLTELG